MVLCVSDRIILLYLAMVALGMAAKWHDLYHGCLICGRSCVRCIYCFGELTHRCHVLNVRLTYTSGGLFQVASGNAGDKEKGG